jgi:hypothetical protein
MPNNKIDVQNINHPGLIKSVDAAMYAAMRKAYLAVVPEDGPGLTLDAIRFRPSSRTTYSPAAPRPIGGPRPSSSTLEAKGVLVRDKSTPLRLRKASRSPIRAANPS